MEPNFLSLETILKIHQVQIHEFGGSDGIRDVGLLQSATAMPQAQFGGQYLHVNLYEMAAAYMYHIALNHPFVDGNKRVGFMAADTFLITNGILLTASVSDIIDLGLEVAQGKVEKPEIVVFFRKHSRKSPKT